MRRGLAIALWLAWCGASFADLPAAIERTQADIRDAVTELNDLRDDIAGRRAPLVAEHRDLQADVARLREALNASRHHQLHKAAELSHIQDEVRSNERNLQYLETGLLEFRRSLDARRGIAEARLIGPALQQIDAGWEPGRDIEVLPAVTAKLLELSRTRDRAMRGGETFAGTCLDAEGTEREGRFALFGPLGYFAADNDGPAGLVITLPGSAYPSLWTATQSAPAIRALVQGEEAVVPVDVSEGNAMKMAQGGLSIRQQFRAGGFVMIPLAAVAGLAALLAGWKLVSLAGIRTDAGKAMDSILAHVRSSEIDLARDAARNVSAPLAPILNAGIEYRDVPREHLEDILHERVLASIPSLDRHLGILAVLGAVAPLLGLLGTVTGMIQTFQLVSLFGSGDANLLSGGISEALITTKFGLVIAVPVLLVHAYLARRVRTIVDALEHTALRFVNQLTRMRGDAG